jgi:hypothetical protein
MGFLPRVSSIMRLAGSRGKARRGPFSAKRSGDRVGLVFADDVSRRIKSDGRRNPELSQKTDSDIQRAANEARRGRERPEMRAPVTLNA